MKFSYGLPYKGSKNSIADWIVDNLPANLFLIDLFAGGCAVTHAAMRRGKFLRYLVNDINEAPQVFYKALFGEYDDPHYKQFVSREMFFGANNMALKLMWSFGNDGKTYIYGKDIEHYKKLCHFQRMGICDVMDFIKADPHYSTHKWSNCQSAMNWERIHNIPYILGGNLESLKKRIFVYQASYEQFQLPDSPLATIYCDIPYKGTDCGCYGGFDHEKFYDWCRKQKHDIYVSEYSMPDDFELVAEKPKIVRADAKDNTKYSMERLFVHRGG